MSTFRLGTFMLPPGEVILIRTLVQLFSQEPAFRWMFVNESPYDALVIDQALQASGAQALPPAKALLGLTARDAAPLPNTLQRPIKAEKLQAWLRAAMETLPRNPVTAAFGAAAAATALPAELPALGQTRFRLLRWPPSALLQSDVTLIRMSSLLSRRALQLAELAELSQQPLEACKLFIESLFAMKLLSCEPVPLASPQEFAAGGQRPAAPALAAAPAPAKVPFYRGLISGIRSRLGL